LPSLFGSSSGAGNNNQVLVSGSIQNVQSGTLHFLQLAKFYDDDAIKGSTSIEDGKYSITLVGGLSYDIFVDRYPSYSDEDPDFTLYVPFGVSTFIANF